MLDTDQESRAVQALYVASEVRTAIQRLERAWLQGSSGCGVSSRKNAHQLYAALASYSRQLNRIAYADKKSFAARCKFAQAIILSSYEARICALIRSYLDVGQTPSMATIQSRAKFLDARIPLKEPVRVLKWEPKAKGGYRPILNFGPSRRACCLIVRDMLAVLGIDSPIDFTRKGGGGERGLVQEACKLIVQGHQWWWGADIKACFASLRPGHFGWLPLDRRLLVNVMFLPKCAKVEMAPLQIPKDLLKGATGASLPPANSQGTLVESAIQMVRRGLPQGSVLSPLLARALVGRTLRSQLIETGAVGLTFCDDLTIGARTKEQLRETRQLVRSACASLSAGPVELHDGPIMRASSGRLDILHYRLLPGRGYRDNPVHVKPGKVRIERFKATLAAKLLAAGPNNDLLQIAESYRKRWFASQAAWTKVPGLSNNISETITLLYVLDFEHGLPMGGPS